jgi:hypothetical protein
VSGGGGRGAGGGRWPHGGAAVKFDLKSNSNHFKTDSNHSKFECSKKNFPELKKIKIKYDCEDFEERNNFFHRNFSRFETNFELKN